MGSGLRVLSASVVKKTAVSSRPSPVKTLNLTHRKSASRVTEFLEQAPRASISFDQHLRMPLHAHQEVVAGALDSLDQLVRRVDRGGQAVAEFGDALVVHAVYFDRSPPVYTLQIRAGRNHSRMRQVIAGKTLRRKIVVLHKPLGCVRNVLQQ